MSKHLLDANVFIQAKNFWYRFETFPGFWKWLDNEREKGNIALIDMVREELLRGNDELSDWVKARKASGWFLSVDDESTQRKLIDINEWVMGQSRFKPTAKEEFLEGADTWLIAKAIDSGAVVVTQEQSNPESKKKNPHSRCMQTLRGAIHRHVHINPTIRSSLLLVIQRGLFRGVGAVAVDGNVRAPTPPGGCSRSGGRLPPLSRSDR